MQQVNKSTGTSISVIACCYNSAAVIPLLLLHLSQQDISFSHEVEIILVDNNSKDDTARLAISEWSKYNHLFNFKVLHESKPGLTNARIAGIKASKGDIIIFCDDDNLLMPDYINNSITLLNDYPELGCIGPGYIEAVDINLNRLEEKWLSFFQDKDLKGLNTSTQFGEKFIPAGTGMVVRKHIAATYTERVETGQYTAVDRTHGRLLSGGDTQIAYTALHLDYEVGLSDKLKLKHLTVPAKLSAKYVRKMYFGCYSNHIIHCEAYPSFREAIMAEPLGNIPLNVLRKAHSIGWRIIRIGKYKHFLAYIGDIKGRLDVRGERSIFLEVLIKILDLD